MIEGELVQDFLVKMGIIHIGGVYRRGRVSTTFS